MMISWDTCYSSVANQYFSTQYQGVLFIIMASVALCIYMITRQQWSNKILGKYHEQVSWVSLNAAVILLIVFLLYYTFVFKPDMTQIIVEQLKGDINV